MGKKTEEIAEYEVSFKKQFGGGLVTVFVYATSEVDAKRQAVSQGIAAHRIHSVKYYGKKGSVGHV